MQELYIFIQNVCVKNIVLRNIRAYERKQNLICIALEICGDFDARREEVRIAKAWGIEPSLGLYTIS